MVSVEDAYRQFAERAYPILLHLDGDLHITFSSPKALEYFGYESEGLAGQNVAAIVAPESVDSFREMLKALAQSRSTACFDTAFVHSNGNRFHAIVLAIPLNEPDAAPAWAVAVCQGAEQGSGMGSPVQRTQFEISMLHQVSNAVLNTLDLNKIIFGILTCVTAHPGLGFTRAFLFIVDWKNNRLRGRMAVGPTSADEAHRTWADLGQVRWTLQDFIDRYDALVAAGSLQLADQIARIDISTESSQDILVETLRSNQPRRIHPQANDPRVHGALRGVLSEAEFVVVPLAVKNEVIGLIVADNAFKVQPITDEDIRILTLFSNHVAVALNNAANYQELQEKIRLLEKMHGRLIQSERLSTIGEMATQVAHEIRNPLVAIGGLARSIVKKLPEDDRNYSKVSTIAKEAGRLEKILQEMLEYCRPMSLALEETDINELLTEVSDFLSELCRGRDVDVFLNLQPSMPRVYLDRHKMTQVLMNIITNAIDAIPAGGRIDLRTLANGTGGAVVEIADTGPGIPGDILPKIFTPFFTTKTRGLGIGLSLSRELVQAHGGRIEVESQEGKGAMFRIVLPQMPNDEPGEKVYDLG